MKSDSFSFAMPLGLVLLGVILLTPLLTHASVRGFSVSPMRVSVSIDFSTWRGASAASQDETEQNSNTGGGVSTEQSDGDNGADATSAGGAGGAGGNNGGATAGNGGDGGNGGGAAPGGLVNAGSSVSNAHAINAINTSIIRFSLR